MRNIHFTIITVVKNDLQGLMKTRKSLEDQEYVNWNHVIIDGNSNDGTKEYLNKLDSRGTVFVSEPDSGVYSAMNKGWKFAEEHSYVYFLNARDIFCDSRSLLEAATELVKSNYPDWGCTTHEEISPDGSTWLCKRVAVPTLRNQLFATGYRSHQAVLMKMSFIRELGGFNESFRIASDWDLIARALLTRQPTTWTYSLGRFELGGLSAHNLLEAHLELKALRSKYLGLNLFEKLLEHAWCAIYLRHLGYKNQLSFLLFPFQHHLRRDRTLSNRKVSPRFRINLLFVVVTIHLNRNLFYRIQRKLVRVVNRHLGLEY